MRYLKILLLLFVIVSVASTGDVPIINHAEAKVGKHRTKSHGRKSKKTGVENVWERLSNGLRIPVFGPSPYGSQQLAVLPAKTALSPQISTTTKPGSGSATEKGRVSSVIIPKKSMPGDVPEDNKSRIRHILGGNKKATELTEAKDHYTALGRMKLAPKEPKESKLRRLFNKGDQEGATGEGKIFKSATIQRYRSRLGMHPELFKNDNVNNELVEGDTAKTPGKSNNKEKSPTAKSQFAINGCADFNKSNVIPMVKQGLLSAHYMQLAEECRLRQNAAYARINRHIGNYGREYLQRVGERARPFLYHIVNSLSKHGLPLDLALLPIVESAYQPTALSTASAAGIWQFIPSTGREFGLTQTSQYDARLDVIAETQAAIRFLSGLRDHYGGDWWLALAAYNAGPGTVDAAISRNREAGLGRDFWSLELPAETMDYVPRLLALSSIFRSIGPVGLNLRPLKNEPYFIKVNIDRDIESNLVANKDLSVIAKLASFDVEEFNVLNAAYLSSKLPNSQPLSFLLPIRNANLLHQSLAFLAQANKNEEISSSLPSVLNAKADHTKEDMPLISLQVNKEPEFFANKTMKQFAGVDTDSDEINVINMAPKISNKEDWVVHYLDSGESLKTVAEFHGVNEEELREANNIKRKQIISLGQRLLVPLKFFSLEPVRRQHPSILFNNTLSGVAGT